LFASRSSRNNTLCCGLRLRDSNYTTIINSRSSAYAKHYQSQGYADGTHALLDHSLRFYDALHVRLSRWRQSEAGRTPHTALSKAEIDPACISHYSQTTSHNIRSSHAHSARAVHTDHLDTCERAPRTHLTHFAYGPACYQCTLAPGKNGPARSICEQK
jgi:hypothetical protein